MPFTKYPILGVKIASPGENLLETPPTRLIYDLEEKKPSPTFGFIPPLVVYEPNLCWPNNEVPNFAIRCHRDKSFILFIFFAFVFVILFSSFFICFNNH